MSQPNNSLDERRPPEEVREDSLLLLLERGGFSRVTLMTRGSLSTLDPGSGTLKSGGLNRAYVLIVLPELGSGERGLWQNDSLKREEAYLRSS